MKRKLLLIVLILVLLGTFAYMRIQYLEDRERASDMLDSQYP